MTSSRREFLKRGSLMALAAGVPLGLSEKAFGMETTKSSSGWFEFSGIRIPAQHKFSN